MKRVNAYFLCAMVLFSGWNNLAVAGEVTRTPIASFEEELITQVEYDSSQNNETILQVTAGDNTGWQVVGYVALAVAVGLFVVTVATAASL